MVHYEKSPKPFQSSLSSVMFNISISYTIRWYMSRSKYAQTLRNTVLQWNMRWQLQNA